MRWPTRPPSRTRTLGSAGSLAPESRARFAAGSVSHASYGNSTTSPAPSPSTRSLWVAIQRWAASPGAVCCSSGGTTAAGSRRHRMKRARRPSGARASRQSGSNWPALGSLIPKGCGAARRCQTQWVISSRIARSAGPVHQPGGNGRGAGFSGSRPSCRRARSCSATIGARSALPGVASVMSTPRRASNCEHSAVPLPSMPRMMVIPGCGAGKSASVRLHHRERALPDAQPHHAMEATKG